jgi:hypothetical protein
MAIINLSGSGHMPPATSGGITFTAYNSNTLKSQKKMLDDALWILRNNLKGYKPCNDCFTALPRGQTFDALMASNSIRISYSKNSFWSTFGGDIFALNIGNDISVTQFAFNRGVWSVAATLVHELAHVNGAPNTTHQAEGTLLCCGMQKGHDPSING